MTHRIAEERALLGVTQRQLADAIGISQPRVAHLESGRTRLTTDLAIRIAAALGVTVDRLLGQLPLLPVEQAAEAS